MSKSPSLKSLLKDLNLDELRNVIAELCKINPKNRTFLELYILSSNEANLEAVTKESKKKIYSHLYGDSMFAKIDLAGARKQVREYSKLLKDYPCQIADMQLYYVETGTEITNEYGDIDERFYNSMESMLGSFCKQIQKHPVCYSRFRDRLINLEAACNGIGWGYGDSVGDMIYELVDSIDT